jgi:hypothetical protein
LLRLLLMTKLTRMLPWVGAAFALAVLASTMRRKGVLRGALDAALDVTPVLGGVKMIAEKIRGRDFIPDRPLVDHVTNGGSNGRA